MTTSSLGISLIELAEGFSPRLYLDEGHPCIGYGCDLTEDEAAMYEGRVIDREQGENLLRSRIVPIETAINSLVRVPLNQNQFDALVDLTYNIGTHAFAASTLLRQLNIDDIQGAARHFMDWVYVNHKEAPALAARRKKEQELFLQPMAA